MATLEIPANAARRYAEQIRALLPPGLAWEFERDGTAEKLLEAFGVELARIEQRAKMLRAEFNPATTSELLDEWERFVGLPDP